MSNPNGTPPVPQQVQVRFSGPDALRVWMNADLAQAFLAGLANQLGATNQMQAAAWFASRAAEMQKWKEDFLRQDQSGIVLPSGGVLMPRG